MLSKGSFVTINASTVISSTGLHNTFRKLLPKEVAIKSPIYEVQQDIASSSSAVFAFIGFDKTDEELGLKAQNVWAYKMPDCGEYAFKEYGIGSVESALKEHVLGNCHLLTVQNLSKPICVLMCICFV